MKLFFTLSWVGFFLSFIECPSIAATWHHPENAFNDAVGIQFNTLESSYYIYPKLALSEGDNGIIGWLGKPGNSPFSLFISEGTVGLGAWKKPNGTFVNFTENEALSFDLAMGQMNTSYVTWVQKVAPDKNALYFAYKDEQGVWHKPADKNDTISLASGWISEPKLAVSPDGTLLVVIWEQFVNDIKILQKREYTPTTGWGPITTVSSQSGYVYGYKLAVGISGKAVISWTEYDSSNYSSKSKLFKSVRNISGVWSVPNFLLDDISVSSSTQIPTLGDVTMNSNGDYLITYSKANSFSVGSGIENMRIFYDGEISGSPVKSQNILESVSSGVETAVYITQMFGRLDMFGKIDFLWLSSNTKSKTAPEQTMPYFAEIQNSEVVKRPNDELDTFYLNKEIGENVSNVSFGLNPYLNPSFSVAAFIGKTVSPTNVKISKVQFRDFENGVWSNKKDILFASETCCSTMSTISAKVNSSNKAIIMWTQHYVGNDFNSQAIYISQYF